jgi:hypothetical protein
MLYVVVILKIKLQEGSDEYKISYFKSILLWVPS